MHMVLCMNLTSFAWSCYDGQMRSVKDLDETQRASKITQMPSLLEFYGYWYVRTSLTQLLLPRCACGTLDPVCRLPALGQ